MKVLVIGEIWDKSKLVQKLIKVRRKNTEFYRNQWVRPEYEPKETLDRNTVKTLERTLKKDSKEIEKLSGDKKTEQEIISRTNRVIKPAGKMIVEQLKKHISKMKDIEELRNVIKKEYAETNKKLKDLNKNYSNGEIKTSDYLEEFNTIKNQCEKASDNYRKEIDSIMQSNIKEVKKILSKLTDLGATKEQKETHFGISKSQIRPSMENALDCYPKNWIEDSAKRGKIKLLKANRGSFRPSDKIGSDTIKISGNDEGRRTSCAIHELGHRMERAVPDLAKYERYFHSDRTKNDKVERLKDLCPNHNYDKSEVTKKDKFIDPYMGKFYDDGSREIVSMGFDMAFTNPKRLIEKDPDMAYFIFGLLASHKV